MHRKVGQEPYTPFLFLYAFAARLRAFFAPELLSLTKYIKMKE